MPKNILLYITMIFSFTYLIKGENENNLTQIDNNKNNDNKNISLTNIIFEEENINNTKKIVNISEIKEWDDDIDIDKVDYAEHIIIVNTHEDQLVESIFYFLSFVMIIYIILFLYKFYKCYCENTIKELSEDNGMKNPQNDPELQRISTTDDENIIEEDKNMKEDEDKNNKDDE